MFKFTSAVWHHLIYQAAFAGAYDFRTEKSFIFNISQHCPTNCKVDYFLLTIFCLNPLQPIEMVSLFLTYNSFTLNPETVFFVKVTKNSLTTVYLYPIIMIQILKILLFIIRRKKAVKQIFF